MSTHIEISTTASRTSAQVRSAIDQLQASIENIEKLKAILDEIASGSDWTSLAGYLGTSDEDAEIVYNLWTSAASELNATNITSLLSRCG